MTEERVCCQCGRPGFVKYGDNYLCIDCHHKLMQAAFMDQQIKHNQLSWASAQLNFTEQQLYQSTGGIVGNSRMTIPPPPSAGIYFEQSNIHVSDSAIGVINPGTLYTINTSIDVINNRGDKELAEAITNLTQQIIDSKEISLEIKGELSQLLDFLASQAAATADKRNKPVIGNVINRISTLMSMTASAITIWQAVQPILQKLVT